MMKIDEISEEKDENRKKILKKELSVLNTEEKSDLFFRHLIWFHLLMSGKILYCHWGWMEEKWMKRM